MSRVYLVPATRSEPEDVVRTKIEALWSAAGLASCFEKNDLAALKLHVGEPGRGTHVAPEIAAAIVRCMRAAGARPFLTDTAVLYRSRRGNGVGHATVAFEHGFGFERMGAPFIPADGLDGSDEVEIPVDGKHFEKVSIASAIAIARSMLVLSHATGHLAIGFGGALKNLGMGCATKKAKLRQHHGRQPRIDPDECTACGECAERCPSDAIEVVEHAVIDAKKCIGCGECIATCLEGAVEFGWSVSGRKLSEKIVEHAAAVIRSKPGRIGYVTAIQAVTADCDCMPTAQEPLLPDVGMLASLDPVAIDQAAHDLVRERAGRTIESMSYPSRDGTAQMRHAESLGLGETRYDLVTLEV